jgi:NAD(P)-dependent dehydrogenase (short-subunit alcohol dehydrogenase family)
MRMELTPGKVAVVTGGASGIGFALADAFAGAGLALVVADVQDDARDAAVEKLAGHGVEVLGVHTDVSKEADVQALAAATMARFGRVDVVCNNAGVGGAGDPWFGPLSSWEWVVGVNLWSVIHGVRAFLPHLVTGGGHIVNTASIAGLIPVTSAPYDATKHAVVALSENLHNSMLTAGADVGVSCLCPGFVRTGIADSTRNWPAELGPQPTRTAMQEAMSEVTRRVIAEGMPPAVVADLVLDAVRERRFWVFPHPEFVELAMARWHTIGEGRNPAPAGQLPGMAPREQLLREMQAAAERAKN